MPQEEQDKQDIKRYRLLRTWNIGLGFKDVPTWVTGENIDKLLDYELKKR